MPEMILAIKWILLSTVFYLKSTHHKHIGDLLTILCWWPIWHSIGPPRFRIVVIVLCKYYVTSDCPCQNFRLLLNCKIEMKRYIKVFWFRTPIRSSVMIKRAHEIIFSFRIITWISEERPHDIVYFLFNVCCLSSFYCVWNWYLLI